MSNGTDTQTEEGKFPWWFPQHFLAGVWHATPVFWIGAIFTLLKNQRRDIEVFLAEQMGQHLNTLLCYLWGEKQEWLAAKGNFAGTELGKVGQGIFDELKPALDIFIKNSLGVAGGTITCDQGSGGFPKPTSVDLTQFGGKGTSGGGFGGGGGESF